MNVTGKDQAVDNTIRMLSADGVQRTNSGHPGLAGVATVLFSQYLKFNPQIPRWQHRDRLAQVSSARLGAMRELCRDQLERFGAAGNASRIDIIPLMQMAQRYARHELDVRPQPHRNAAA